VASCSAISLNQKAALAAGSPTDPFFAKAAISAFGHSERIHHPIRARRQAPLREYPEGILASLRRTQPHIGARRSFLCSRLKLAARPTRALELRDIPSVRVRSPARWKRCNQAANRIHGKLEFIEAKIERSFQPHPEASRGVRVEPASPCRIAHRESEPWAGSKWVENGLCFTSRLGTPLDGPNVTNQFQRLLQVSGLPKMRFHDLRHSAATLLIAQGVHPRTVMEILGHSQIGITMNLYGHILPGIHDEAAEKNGRSVLNSHQRISEAGHLMRKLLISMVGPPGLEPGTNGL
jgi:integrase